MNYVLDRTDCHFLSHVIYGLVSSRYLSDAHMLSIANHCKGMEQLDILGAMKVTDSGIDM